MKYCKNCKKETDRYKSGHCKPCIKSRTDIANQKRSEISQSFLNYEKVNEGNAVFNKDDYKEFDIREVISNPKNKYIYFLLKEDNLVYIGKSNGWLLSRLNSHIKNKDFDNVYLRSVNDEKSLEKYEKKWIEKYRPKLNKEFIFNGITYDIFDLKTEDKISQTKEELLITLNTNKSTLDGLLSEKRNKIYSRYVLYKNRPKESNFRRVLDTHTGNIEKHNYITFSEKVGKSQNAVWYFLNGIQKTFMKKRYIIQE